MWLYPKSENSGLNRKSAAWCCICVISALGLVICMIVLFPRIRLLLINLAEQFLAHKKITSERWMLRLFTYAKSGIFCIILFDFFVLTLPGRIFLSKIKNEMKVCCAEIDVKKFLKAVLFLSCIYLLGLISLIRANYSYDDDLNRAIHGLRGWSYWSRYLADFLSTIIHADINLTDISPLPQILAVLIIAFAGVLLVYILTDNKITVITLLAGIPVGLSPYFLQCLSFKFDAPYMALSVLASIIPFLFIRMRRAFAFCSVMSLWIMCMTYQASSVYMC